MLFWDDFDLTLTFSQLRVDKGHFGQFKPEKALRVLRCSNRLRHVNLDVFVALWVKDNIFRIFEVQHTNQGQTKYPAPSLFDILSSMRGVG